MFCALITSECIILIQFFAICEEVAKIDPLTRPLIGIIIYKMIRKRCNIFWGLMEVSSTKTEGKFRAWCSFPSVFGVDTSINPKKYYNDSFNHYPLVKPSASMATCTPPLQLMLCMVLWYRCIMWNLLVHRLVGSIGSLTSHSKIFQLYLTGWTFTSDGTA